MPTFSPYCGPPCTAGNFLLHGKLGGYPTSMKTHQRILKLNVNGHPKEILARDADTLLDVLREALGLTGSKRGCDLGTCGCCTVQVDGKPILSCLTLACEMEGKNIRSVEDLAQSNQLAPLQECWAEAGASQCGFCSPGFLMTADALLRENPDPNREQIKKALAGNLCRCTGYVKILDAVEACAKKTQEIAV